MSSNGSGLAPVCLITGASAGIGAELARVFARHGHPLVLTARRETELNALADAILAEGHTRPHVIAADLADPQGPAHLAEAMQKAGLEPSIVVNNAGFGLLGEAARLDLPRQLAIVDLNNRALTDLSLRFVGSIKRHRGGILNVASIAGFLPGPGMAVYHASKAYVVSFSDALHAELKGDGVKVCVLCPGPVATEFYGQAGIPDDYFPAFLARGADRVAREGYAGFLAGRRMVAPGTLNLLMTLLPRFLPRALVTAYTGWRWRLRRG
jgi:short-subunit dehydrogenase